MLLEVETEDMRHSKESTGFCFVFFVLRQGFFYPRLALDL